MTNTAISSSVGRARLIYTILLMAFIYAFVMLFIYESDTYRVTIEKEVLSSLSTLEPDAQKELLNTTRARQYQWVHASGLYETLHDLFMPKRDVKYIEDMSKGILSKKYLVKFLKNFQYLSYQIIHRLTLLEFWAYTIFAFMVCLMVQGYYKWKIKQYRLGGQSVNATRIWTKIIWLTFLGLLGYLIIPNVFGAYSFQAPAILLIIASLAASKVAESYNKYA